jgi:hypothetical protein
MTMRLTMPETARQVPIAHRDRAVAQLTGIIGELRDSSSADLEAIAVEAVDAAIGEGAVLMAVVAPPGAAPALLTGVVLEVPPSWSDNTAELLRDSLEDVGGPDLRETLTLDTGIGPAVLAQRVPGVEQARERKPLALQLQAFVPEPGTGRMLLLTLASPSVEGWDTHQILFGMLVASASASSETDAEESFEHRTYRL